MAALGAHLQGADGTHTAHLPPKPLETQPVVRQLWGLLLSHLGLTLVFVVCRMKQVPI